jgi:cysteine-rich repeat protein
MRLGSVGNAGGCLLLCVALGCNNDPDETATPATTTAPDTTQGETTTGPPTTSTPGDTSESTAGPEILCGNAEIDPGEACDDGNVDNTDNCLENCTLAVCGDGFMQAGLEQCDDNNDDADDSCVPGCYAATCGDGYHYVGVEECDDGNKQDNDACTNDCKLPTTPPMECGNGQVEAEELCDDGNLDNDDNCVMGCVPWSCGDGFVHSVFETCDDANIDNHDDCVDVGGQCVDASCGDGYLHDGVEGCDDGNLSDTDDCLNTCSVAKCGDAVIHDGAEVCDDGVNDGAYGGCNSDCLSPGPLCGDAKLDQGFETCDDGNTMPGDGCDGACQAELPPECLGAIELAESDRAASFNDGPGGVKKCDSATADLWHRFNDPAGSIIPMTAPTQYSCGTDSPGWMMGALPTEAEGIVGRTACFLWMANPCKWSTAIQVLNCGDYYVYRLPNPPETCLRYCAGPP